ncbi:MAG: hypothetical protein K6C06_09270 [Lachnospiraceae bacterium]|nr:hypothetical protein [Lachnospiraceae bacterium]
MDGEIRLYEALGIRIFQKMVFRLERFRHRGDGDRNVNYHMLPAGTDSPERFIRYLFLNAGIHISGLAATLVFMGIFAVMPGVLPTVWAAGVVGVIGNIYCIMLQRYNYLRIMKVVRKQEERLAKQTDLWKERVYGWLRQADDPAMLREGAQCLHRMREDVARQGYTIIRGSDESALAWLAAASGAKPAARKKRGADSAAGGGKTAGKTGDAQALWRPEMVPYTAKERKAQRVMRFLGRPVSDPPMSVFFAESEEALSALRELLNAAPPAGTYELLEMAERMLTGQKGAAAGSAGETGGKEIRPEGAGKSAGIQELGYDRKGLPCNIFRETVLSVLQPGKKRKLKPDPAAQALLGSALSEGRISPAGLYALRNEENRELCDRLLLRLFMYCASDFTEELRDPELKGHLEALAGEYLRECRRVITTSQGFEKTAAEMTTAAAREEDNRKMAVLNCRYLSRKARACGLALSEHVLVW